MFSEVLSGHSGEREPFADVQFADNPPSRSENVVILRNGVEPQPAPAPKNLGDKEH